jgi:hypothetical protein
MITINKQHQPFRSNDIVFQSMPPDTVLLNLETGYYFSTNRLGAEVWNRCDGETTVAAIIESLHQQFDVSLEQLTDDVENFIALMVKEELLKVSVDE